MVHTDILKLPGVWLHGQKFLAAARQNGVFNGVSMHSRKYTALEIAQRLEYTEIAGVLKTNEDRPSDSYFPPSQSWVKAPREEAPDARHIYGQASGIFGDKWR